MELTLEELKERLKKFEETQLLELLQVTSDLLVERFEDFIEDNYEYLVTELEQEESLED